MAYVTTSATPTIRLDSLLRRRSRAHTRDSLMEFADLCKPNSATSRTSGSWGSNIAVNDWHAAMTLTWPWWSLEGYHDCSETYHDRSLVCRRFHSNSSVERGF